MKTKQPETFLKLGNTAFRNKDYITAIKYYEKAIKELPELTNTISTTLKYALRKVQNTPKGPTAYITKSQPHILNNTENSPPPQEQTIAINKDLNAQDYISEKESEIESNEDINIIKESGLFSEQFYLSTYPDVAKAGINPLEHFCLYGWREGRNPNRTFNSSYYLEKHQDVALAGMNPFIHWIKFGRGEGRKTNLIEVDPLKEVHTHNPSIIFISHEASQTGAPAVLLSLIRWIKENTDLSFSIIIGAQGPWNERFEELAPCFYMDASHPHGLTNELRAFCGSNVQAVYVNTIASGLYAEHLNYLDAEFITHVHEMENVFRIFEPHFNTLKKFCRKYIAVSQGSLDAIKKRTEDKVSITFLKPFIDKKIASPSKLPKPTQKKIIFGCGAVETRKGFDLFCEVALEIINQGYYDFKMYWIGSAENKDLNPHTEIQKRNLGEYVEWIGSKDYPRDYFEWGDLFLLPSREDPYPLVCMEAAECNMPIICFDRQAGSMHTFVEHDAGVVVPYLDIKAMAAQAILLLNDDKHRKTLGALAAEKVKERHYVEVIAPQILKLFPEINKKTKNTEFENYQELIDTAKAVSFDIFDTLITRKLSNPNIVFDIIEYKHTLNESATLPLFQERMDTAGRVLGSYLGEVDDICINEIYKNMSFFKESHKEKETEIQMCVPHPLGVKLYQYAIKKNKKIYIASDMYLDQPTIEAILRKCGITQWDQLFLSSALGKKKDTGRLYAHMLQEAHKSGLSADDIVHIGDNWIGDIRRAKEAGIKARRFTPIGEKKYKLFPISAERYNLLSQIGKIWDSFCTQSTHLWHEHNPTLASDFYIKLGFELTGPLAAMMAIHAKIQAEQNGVKKIVFMARDGRIIKKAFDVLYRSEIENGLFEPHYLHLSRATVVPATFDNPLSSNDIFFLIEGLHLAQKPVSYFLEKAGLEASDKAVQKIVQQYFQSTDIVPAWSDLNLLSQMFGQLSNQIYDAHEQTRETLKQYLEQHELLTEEKIIVVDVGWLLNIQSRLDKFVKSIDSKTNIIGCYVGSRDRVNKTLPHSALLFDYGDPYLYAKFVEDNTTLFEVLFSAPEPSARALTLDEDTGNALVAFKTLSAPLPSEFVVAQKIQMGAEDFFKCFNEARQEFFPEQISKDYFFYLFEALATSKSEVAKATLGQFEVRLGGHHEFISHENLIKNDNPYFEYALKKKDEYFDPITFGSHGSDHKVVIITSAGLDNGSTRYRGINLADALQYQGICAALMHAATPIEQAEVLIQEAESIIFQRCFEEQGHVGHYLNFAKTLGKRCLAEMDDLVFPKFISTIGSVKGGEWRKEEAIFVATSYEKLIKQVDACIVSTPILKEYIEEQYCIPAYIIRNKIRPKHLYAPRRQHKQPLKLIYASGTYSHKQDFATIENVLYDFLTSHSEVQLSILGAAQVSERILALPNVANYPLLPYMAMLEFIARHHLMLVPLVDDIFNRAKSNVKFVECGAVGIPVLASNVGEFAHSITHMKNGLLASTKEEWTQCLEFIRNHPEAIEGISKNAKLTINSQYTTLTFETNLKNLL